MMIGWMKFDLKGVWDKVLHGPSFVCPHRPLTDWFGCAAGTKGDVRIFVRVLELILAE
jgi:hypothetical protein